MKTTTIITKSFFFCFAATNNNNNHTKELELLKEEIEMLEKEHGEEIKYKNSKIKDLMKTAEKEKLKYTDENTVLQEENKLLQEKIKKMHGIIFHFFFFFKCYFNTQSAYIKKFFTVLLRIPEGDHMRPSGWGVRGNIGASEWGLSGSFTKKTSPSIFSLPRPPPSPPLGAPLPDSLATMPPRALSLILM